MKHAYSTLDALRDLKEDYKNETHKLQEARKPFLDEPGKAIDLHKARVIETDVLDIRGEYESNTCIDYMPSGATEPILTRVQTRAVILKAIKDKIYFLGRYFHRVYLPGGGFDLKKDAYNPANTVKRELREEVNLEISTPKEISHPTWKYKSAAFVKQHVAKEEDRWYGYYTFFYAAKAIGDSDNDNPEESGGWKWLPLERLGELADDPTVKALASELLSQGEIQEAVYPTREIKSFAADAFMDNPGNAHKVSYLCDSLKVLATILGTMQIRRTNTPEAEIFTADKKQAKRMPKYFSVSTSRDILGHASRRPIKWGFGVVFDADKLSTYYDMVEYNHALTSLDRAEVTKVFEVVSDEDPSQNGYYMTILNFGTFKINEDIFDYAVQGIMDTCKGRSNLHIRDKTLPQNNTQVSTLIRDATHWWWHGPFYRNGSEFIENLQPKDVPRLYVFRAVEEDPTTGKRLRYLNLIDCPQYAEMKDWISKHTKFNEQEERIWLKNKGIEYLQIPPSTLTDIVLPDYFKDDFESSQPENGYLRKIKDKVIEYKLGVIYHGYGDSAVSQREYAKIAADNKLPPPLSDASYNLFLQDARELLQDYQAGKISLSNLKRQLPYNELLRNILSKAFAAQMIYLTDDNYDSCYKKAYDQAWEEYKELTKGVKSLEYKITPGEFKNIFNYYCPESPLGYSDNLSSDINYKN